LKEGESLDTQRAILLANKLQDFTHERRLEYDERGIKLYPGEPAEIKERADFDRETTVRFTDFDLILTGIIDQFSKKGVNVTALRENRDIVVENRPPVQQPPPIFSYIATGITTELRRLAEQIDNDGRLTH